MDPNDDAAEAAVGAAIEEFLANVPDDPLEQRGRLYDLGLAWVHHPRGRGGLDAPRRLQGEVLRRIQSQGYAEPTLASGGGVALAGPTMATHGDDQLCDRLLRR